jgi:hypothetical protein
MEPKKPQHSQSNPEKNQTNKQTNKETNKKLDMHIQNNETQPPFSHCIPKSTQNLNYVRP